MCIFTSSFFWRHHSNDEKSTGYLYLSSNLWYSPVLSVEGKDFLSQLQQQRHSTLWSLVCDQEALLHRGGAALYTTASGGGCGQPILYGPLGSPRLWSLSVRPFPSSSSCPAPVAAARSGHQRRPAPVSLGAARPATSLKPRYVGHTINLCSQKTTWSPFRQSNNQPTVWSSRFLGQWKTCCLLAIGFLPPSPLLWPSYHRSSQTWCALIRRVLSLWPFSSEFQWNLQSKFNSIKI